MKQIQIVILIFLTGTLLAPGQTKDAYYPLIGAQVFIEPGQTARETEQWFRVMKENGMTVCRIRMFESYMHKADGTWDFSLFDRAFRLAEKYDIKIMGTFFPATDKTDIGGWKFPHDFNQLDSFADYIKALVLHFRQFKSLYAWVLINEPGGGLRNNEFSRQMRSEWDKKNPVPEFLDNGYPLLVDLQDYRFRMYMTSWMLNWIAGEVRKYDKEVQLHVNNHAMFSNFQEYDFPYWRTFLSSLGGSAHAAWHFGQFSRKEYALAMSANSEILLSGAGPLPWFMTELQGGNNTFSGMDPMCPTAEEIAQWLWIVTGTGGKGGVFWTLNPRSSGIESGEWALLDFQDQPTDRLRAIAEVSRCISENPAIFNDAKKADPGIDLVYLRESEWTENVITRGVTAATDGRKTGLADLLGYFQAFSEAGISPNIKAFEEYDFSQPDYTGRTMILANQMAIASDRIKDLENLVRNGGRLIVDGLTGYYDGNVLNVMHTGFPLKDLFGSDISEFRYLGSPEQISLPGASMAGPGILWKGFIKPLPGADILAMEGDHVVATRMKFGKGEVIWVPSLLGAAARKDDRAPLTSWLMSVCKPNVPFRFNNPAGDMVMKTLVCDGGYVTILINKSSEVQKIDLVIKDPGLKGSVLFADKGGSVSGNKITIHPEETIAITWNLEH